MNFFDFHIGDYTTRTAHLEPIEDLAYRRLLDLYYTRECKIPLDIQEVARLLRLKQHSDAVELVLCEFFTKTAEGWAHERCDREIAKAAERRIKASISGKASAMARLVKNDEFNERSTTVQRPFNSESTTVQLPTTNYHIPTTIEKEKNTKKENPDIFCPRTFLKTIGCSDQVANDFLAMRKAKRAPASKTALEGIAKQAGLAGLTIDRALATALERGWMSFKADWVRLDKTTADPLEWAKDLGDL